MDIIKRAMLGDKKAQEEITARGELLPCPHCGKEASIIKDTVIIGDLYGVRCGDENCCAYDKTAEYSDLIVAIADWNTRPQILTYEEMEKIK